MGKQITTAIVTSLIIWFLTFVINSALGYLVQSNINILINQPIVKSNEIFVPLELTNYTKDYMNDIVISLPITSNVEDKPITALSA